MRLIDADALDAEMYRKSFEVDDGRNVWNSGLWIRYKIFEEAIRDAPTVNAVPVRHGKWIVWDEVIAGIYHTVSECSECGFTTDKMFREEMPHCPNCGARMDEK